MGLTLVTAPAVEPITLSTAKLHLRVDTADEDGLISSLLTAARQHVESYTHRALVTQTWDWKLDAFPSDGEPFVLPLPPVISVTSITYLDTAGASQTWGASNYITDLPAGDYASRARIAAGYGVAYPATYAVINAVTVRFVAGYGAASTVPEAIKAAIKILVADWYATRETAPGVTVPTSVDALLWPYKAF